MTEQVTISYLNESLLPYPFCPGCGHGSILNNLSTALAKLQLDRRKVVIVSDIGCVGLSDKYFDTNSFHGLHGRSVTYATGIKLANPELNVVVLMGDGGCGIGGHHLINAARRNIGVTVLVFNNLNFGMTGGEHSVATPQEAVTATTMYGQLERPMEICATVAVNGAGLVARTTSFDKSLPDLIAQAIQNECFSLIDIWELCTAYYVPNNKFSKKLLDSTLDSLNYATGIIHQEPRPEYSRAYRKATSGQTGQPVLAAHPLKAKYRSNIISKLNCIIAGAAGQKIGSAASALSRGAMLSGLWVTQRNDYPPTVKSGYSVSELILSPEEICFTGIAKPDLMIVLFPEGLAKVRSRVESLTENDTLYINSKLLPVKTRAKTISIDFSKAGKKQYWAMMAMAVVLRHSQLYPLEAFKEAVSIRKEFAEENLAAIERSKRLAG
jgi:pyruvate/2-oxoacid:ferredoxin oxidoreductase beta subunit/Pyruvate/2-oxoacid:ferredoxin oxidoreductase gamma subunit